MSVVAQRSFAGGEIAPSLYSRVDTVKYQTGLKTCRNFLVMRHGGVTNRPGSQFIGEVSDSTKTVRLIPFVFNSTQTYVLEFGNLYMRVIRDGSYITVSQKNITAATKANPIVITSNSHGYSNGDEVYISGVGGMTQLNNRNFKIASAASNTYSLAYMDGTLVNSTAFGTYTSGGTTDKIYQITTPFIERDLQELKTAQSADVVTIVHYNYAPRELSRTAHDSWVLSTISFAPEIAAPAGQSAAGGGTTGSTTYNYKVTTIAAETFEESLPSGVAAATDGNATLTATNNVTVSWSSVSGAQEYNIYKESNGIYGFIGVAGGTTFVDIGIVPDTADTPPTARNPFDKETSKTITGITAANPGVVTTSAAHGYNVGDLIFIASVVGMTQVNNLYFIVRTVPSTTTFTMYSFDEVVINSSGYTAYSSGGTVQRVHNYPSTVSYFQQRLEFANTRNDPEKIWTSRTGQFHNYTTSTPLQDDDAVTFNLAGRQVNAVENLIELGKQVVFTTGGEWVVDGDAAGILKPGDINPKQHSYNGSSDLPPLIIGGSALYVQSRGSIVRDLSFDYQVDGYRGNDLTIFAAHLFDNYTLLDWAYQQIPQSVVWCVRSDGVLLGLTYVKEQQIVGWHKHDFDGYVENVCVVPEGTEDAVYVVVNRTIDGDEKRYVERLNSRQVIDIKDSIFVDCALSYDGRNTTSTHTMTLSGSGWTYTDTLTLTSSASYFTAAEVGNEIHLVGEDADGETVIIRAAITAYTSATVVSIQPNKTVPVPMRSLAISDWTRAVDQISGLWHLEDKDVSVFADGFVVANPNNDAYGVITVASGSITLDKCYGVIHVGLPITADLETLDIDTVQGESIADKKKIINRLSIFVESSRGIFAGAVPPEDEEEDFLGGLAELKIRDSENYDEPVALQTGTVEIIISPEWNSNGRVFIRQTDPVPLSVLAVVPSGLIPFKRSQNG